ncbi:hypothetical protein FAZ95_14000 [Trinickia violacea]|uniref:ASCH domain-containing protein n=1 Tax=Trinickia violacea TaxID=2571746 RepID=A0A4P8IR84_9BURK|nr:hypothetical protein [Trinickia violacea]QCP50195.1 hypothetical protein FAZ95_14000 [Trinickia violacea]
MTERPILFSGPMVRAILDGRKTQTRRPLKFPEPKEGWHISNCPYGRPGDRLWVRETCRADELPDGLDGVRYLADDTFAPIANTREAAERWIELNAYRGQAGAAVPSIHMPRWASRITLEIAGVRVERLQDISYEDALAEGVSDFAGRFADDSQNTIGETPEQTARRLEWPQRQYRLLWDNLNAARGYGWDMNPWVWVLEFRRIV